MDSRPESSSQSEDAASQTTCAYAYLYMSINCTCTCMLYIIHACALNVQAHTMHNIMLNFHNFDTDYTP